MFQNLLKVRIKRHLSHVCHFGVLLLCFVSAENVIQRGSKGDGDFVPMEPSSAYQSAYYYPNLKPAENWRKVDHVYGNSSGSVGAGFRVARTYPMDVMYKPRYGRHSIPLRYRNVVLDPSQAASDSWGGKWLSHLKRRTNMIMNPTTGYDGTYQMQNEVVGMAAMEEPDVAATYHGSSGGGYGGSGGGGYGKGVNKSAVGLLGFLSLLSLIQNVLNQTALLGRRKRRDVSDGLEVFEDDSCGWQRAATETAQIVPYILPTLSAVAHAQKGEIPVECTLQPICHANQVLTEKLGGRGRSGGKVLSNELSKMLKRRRPLRSGGYEVGISSRILRAGMSGRSGKNCRELYKECSELTKLPPAPAFLQRIFL